MDVSPVTLLVIGMFTVFVVLVLVVLVGNLLISIINKHFPEELPKTVAMPQASGMQEKNKIAAIMAAVEWVTKGKGKVTKIEKKK